MEKNNNIHHRAETHTECEQKIHRLIDSTGEGIYSLDADGNCTLANRACVDLLGYEEASELIGKPIHQLIHHDCPGTHSPTFITCQDCIVFQKGEPVFGADIQIQRTDGLHFSAEFRCHPVYDKGIITGAVASFTDITARKRAERALQKAYDELESRVAQRTNELQAANKALMEKERQFRSMFTSSAIGMAILSPDAQLLQVNSSLCFMLGYSEKELLNKTIQDITHPDDVQISTDHLRRLLEGGIDAAIFEKRYLHKEGHTVWGSISASLLQDTQGTPLHFVTQIQDITRRKLAEQELIRYQDHLETILEERSTKLARSEKELKEFAYIVSHDLRAPLTSIQGFTGELRYGLKLLHPAVEAGLPHFGETQQVALKHTFDQRIPEAMDFIETSTTKMNALVKAILKLSRMGHQKLSYEPVDIELLVKQELKTLAYAIETQEITIEQSHLPTLYTDPLVMQQIFGNLLSNAIKYRSPEQPGIIKITAEQDHNGTTFHVRDNGRGIAADEIDRVFKIYQRAGDQKEPGEGMGLTYVKTLVLRLDGDIWCQSELGEGTTFSFNLPQRKRKRADK
ncbi:MAG: PAS domain S-box protein [Candidatus Polarisedimenticolaceae bacterium]|nr:PAS domain S-box protein [Candidatus Polarisedimenticolaceae bacterium]